MRSGEYAQAESAAKSNVAVQAVSPGSICPTCARRIPVPHEDHTPRQRQQVNLSVPKDAGEDGEQVLREHIAAALASPLARDVGYDQNTPPYFVIVAALYLYSISPADEEIDD